MGNWRYRPTDRSYFTPFIIGSSSRGPTLYNISNSNPFVSPTSRSTRMEERFCDWIPINSLRLECIEMSHGEDNTVNGWMCLLLLNKTVHLQIICSHSDHWYSLQRSFAYGLDELVLAWILCHDHAFVANILQESLNVLPLETVKASWWVAVCVSGRFSISCYRNNFHLGRIGPLERRASRTRASSAYSRLAFHDVTLQMGPCTQHLATSVSCWVSSFISCLTYPFGCITFDVDVAFDPSVLGGSILVPWKRMTANFNPFSEALYHVTDRWNVFTWCSGCIGRYGQWAHKSGILSVWLGQWLLSARRQVIGWSQGHLLCRNWSENDGYWFDGTNGTVFVLCKLGITYVLNITTKNSKNTQGWRLKHDNLLIGQICWKYQLNKVVFANHTQASSWSKLVVTIWMSLCLLESCAMFMHMLLCLRGPLNVLPLETVKASWWVAVCVSGRFSISCYRNNFHLGRIGPLERRASRTRASSAYSRLAFHDVTLKMGPCTQHLATSVLFSCFMYLLPYVSLLLHLFWCWCWVWPTCCGWFHFGAVKKDDSKL